MAAYIDTVEGIILGQLLELVFVGGAQKAKKFITSAKVVRVSMHGKRDDKHYKAALVFVGPPNTEERRDLEAGRSRVGHVEVKYMPTKEELAKLKKLYGRTD